jgi:lipoyl(octanoyl) transferase
MATIRTTNVRFVPARSSDALTESVVVRDLGIAEYRQTWEAMRAFTATRDAQTPDELWLVEHPPVYTLGTNDRREPFDNPTGIPVVQSDRGGQITYHGPGQLVVYTLLDLRRRGWGVKALVQALEQSVIDLLTTLGLAATRRTGAPGVYVEGRKIAQLGLRVRQRGSYHGLSLNVAMDHQPFRQIHPCGYAGLETTDLALLLGPDRVSIADIRQSLVSLLLQNLGYNPPNSL